MVTNLFKMVANIFKMENKKVKEEPFIIAPFLKPIITPTINFY